MIKSLLTDYGESLHNAFLKKRLEIKNLWFLL